MSGALDAPDTGDLGEEKAERVGEQLGVACDILAALGMVEDPDELPTVLQRLSEKYGCEISEIQRLASLAAGVRPDILDGVIRLTDMEGDDPDSDIGEHGV